MSAVASLDTEERSGIPLTGGRLWPDDRPTAGGHPDAVTTDHARRAVADIIHGRWKAEALSVALRLGVPEALRAGPARPEELAMALHVHPDGLRKLTRVLVACGLFTETADGALSHNDASRRLLADHPQTQLRDASYMAAPFMTAAWDNLESAICRPARPAAAVPELLAHLGAHPAQDEVFRAYRAGVAEQNMAALQTAYRLPGVGTVVVLGADNLPALSRLLGDRPSLRGIIYDMPGARTRACRALARLSAAQARPRLAVITGNWFRWAPAGGDVYILPHVLHDWPDSEALRLLQQLALAMAASSELVVLAADLRSAGSHLLPAYLDLAQLLLCGGRERTEADYRGLLARAGLEVLTAQPVPGRAGIRILVARRQPPDGAPPGARS